MSTPTKSLGVIAYGAFLGASTADTPYSEQWEAAAEAVKAAVLADLPPASPWRSVNDPPENEYVVLYGGARSPAEGRFSERNTDRTHWTYPPKQDTPEKVSAKEFNQWWNAWQYGGRWDYARAAWQAARGFGGAK